MIDEDHGNILIKLGYAFDVKTQRNLILRNQVLLMKVSKNTISYAYANYIECFNNSSIKNQTKND